MKLQNIAPNDGEYNPQQVKNLENGLWWRILNGVEMEWKKAM